MNSDFRLISLPGSELIPFREESMTRRSRIPLHVAALVAGLLFSGLAGSAWGQQPTGPGTGAQSAAQTAAKETSKAPTPDPQAPASAAKDAPAPTLADFAWLDGQWKGQWGPRVAEQDWMAPKAGMMTGVFRLVEGDKTLVLEMFTLVEKPDGINFYFRHFTPELVPWEKADATVLNLVSVDAKKIEFENPVNGQPKRAILLRVDMDTYTARSEIAPEQGDKQVIEITYHRVKPAPPEKSNAKNGAHR
jgi:uncharacterized protein DUF6265